MVSCGVYYLLDTNIIFNLFEKDTNKTIEINFLNKHSNCAISTYSWYKILKKINNIKKDNEKQVFYDFLMEVIAPNIKLIAFDEHAALIASEIACECEKKHIPYNDEDIQLYSISVSNNLILITDNYDKYDRIRTRYTLNAEVWR